MGGGLGGLAGGTAGFLTGGPVGAAAGYGIGSSLDGGGKQSAPPAPDYVGAARETSRGNLEMAKYATQANRVNQTGPYGSLKYSQDPQGNWSAVQSLSPEQQKLYEQQTGIQGQFGDLANKGLGNAAGLLGNPTIDESKLAQMPQNAGMNTQEAMMSRLRPDIDRQRAQMDTQLANQGIQQGSEAWKNAKEQQGREFSDRENQAALAGIQTDMAARQQEIGNQSNLMNQPLNVINSLRSGSQVTPQNYVNPAQQATTAGADILGATNSLYTNQVNANNAANAQRGNMISGLMGLGGAYLMSDPRTKENKKIIATRADGLNIYEFEYKQEFKEHGEGKQIGVMADEVEILYPDAVIIKNGYKMVNYGMLGV